MGIASLRGVAGTSKWTKDHLSTNADATRLAKIDYLTGNVALASTALSNVTWTNALATKLNTNVDAKVSNALPFLGKTPDDFCTGLYDQFYTRTYTTAWTANNSSAFWDAFSYPDTLGATNAGTAVNTWHTTADVTSGSGLFLGFIGPYADYRSGQSLTKDLRITIDGTAYTYSASYTLPSNLYAAMACLPPVCGQTHGIVGTSGDSFRTTTARPYQDNLITVSGCNGYGALSPLDSPVQWLRAGWAIPFYSSLKVEHRFNQAYTGSEMYKACAYYYLMDL